MGEPCKTCKKKFDSEIWIAPQFADEGILLFCSEECKKEYLRRKLGWIKMEYPKYYERLKERKIKSIFDEVL